jgi:superkiller protein 3
MPEPVVRAAPPAAGGFRRLPLLGAFAVAASLLVVVGWILAPTRDSIEMARANRELQAGRADEALARLGRVHPERLQDRERTELPTLVETAAYQSASKALTDGRFDDAARAFDAASNADVRSARIENLRLLASAGEEAPVPGELTLAYRGSLLDRGFTPKGGRKTRGGPASHTPPERQAAWGRAAKEHPDSTTLQLNYGEFLLTLGKPQEAVAVFQRVIEREPRNEAAHLGLGLALAADERDPQRFEKALAEFRTAEGLDPNSLPAQINIAVCLEALGDRPGAQQYWERVLPRINDPARRDQITDLIHSNK